MDRDLTYYLSLDYPVEIRRIDETLGGGYSAGIPSLGSLAFAGDGSTPQEAYDNLLAAKKEIFADYLEQGIQIPEPPIESGYEQYSGRLVVRMPRALHARLSSAAASNETSLNQFIVYALSSFEAGWSPVRQLEKIAVQIRNDERELCWTRSATTTMPAAEILQEGRPLECYVDTGASQRTGTYN